MTDGSPQRWIMRQAMIELLTGSERELVNNFLQQEAMWRSDDPFLSSSVCAVWSFMVAKALAGEVEITGHRDRGPEGVIPLGFLVNSRPNLQKQMLLTDAGIFLGVLVSVKEASPMRTGAKLPDVAASATKGRGGRAPTHDWTRVAAEVVRIAHMEELGNRRLLVARMIDWCAANLDTHPDPSTVRKYIIDLCPADLPAE